MPYTRPLAPPILPSAEQALVTLVDLLASDRLPHAEAVRACVFELGLAREAAAFEVADLLASAVDAERFARGAGRERERDGFRLDRDDYLRRLVRECAP